MNYQWHYNRLIERGKNRVVDGYTERHHIVPRCIGGSNDPDNLVVLTPEEHYVAHQLLVKMYPGHSGLVYAAVMMTRHDTKNRSDNKIYGWLKRKQQKIAKSRTGKQNGSYGRSWYHNPETLEKVKCLPEEVPKGFVKGGVPNNKCVVCNSDTGTKQRKYCNLHKDLYRTQNRPDIIKDNIEKLKAEYEKTGSLKKAFTNCEIAYNGNLYAKFRKYAGIV